MCITKPISRETGVIQNLKNSCHNFSWIWAIILIMISSTALWTHEGMAKLMSLCHVSIISKLMTEKLHSCPTRFNLSRRHKKTWKSTIVLQFGPRVSFLWHFFKNILSWLKEKVRKKRPQWCLLSAFTHRKTRHYKRRILDLSIGCKLQSQWLKIGLPIININTCGWRETKEKAVHVYG